jgi:hypothetical protein
MTTVQTSMLTLHAAAIAASSRAEEAEKNYQRVRQNWTWSAETGTTEEHRLVAENTHEAAKKMIAATHQALIAAIEDAAWGAQRDGCFITNRAATHDGARRLELHAPGKGGVLAVVRIDAQRSWLIELVTRAEARAARERQRARARDANAAYETELDAVARALVEGVPVVPFACMGESAWVRWARRVNGRALVRRDGQKGGMLALEAGPWVSATGARRRAEALVGPIQPNRGLRRRRPAEALRSLLDEVA